MSAAAKQTRIQKLLAIEVPVIVRLAEREMNLDDILKLMPGTILELGKPAEDELDLLINNKPIGTGIAVKLGENFGIQITYIGDLRSRLDAIADEPASGDDDADAALAEQLLAGQL